MLGHLVDLAHKLEADGEVIPLGYKQFSDSTPIEWVITIDRDRGARAREESITKPRPSRQRAGKPSPTNLKPYFLADQARYAIGTPEEGKEEEAELLHGGFRQLIRDAAEQTGDGALQQIAERLEQEPIHKAINAEIDPRDYVTFDVPGESQLPFEKEAARRFWAAYVEEEFTSDHEGTCSVCGEHRALIQTLPQMVTLMGERCQISSFNLSAFASYGKKQTLNASLCYECGARAAQALNYLVKKGEHRVQLARNPRDGARASLKDHLAVFWSTAQSVETEDGQPVDPAAVLRGATTGDLFDQDGEEYVTEGQIAQLLETPWHAREAGLQTGDAGVHLLVLSPNKARLVVRGWLYESLESFRTNLRDFVDATKMEDPYGRDSRPFGVLDLLDALAVNGVDPDTGRVRSRREVQANQVRNLLRTAYSGDSPPQDLKPTAVRLLRNPHVWSTPWLNHRLVAVLKFSDSWNGQRDGEIMQEQKALEDEVSNPGRLCGRLMAVLENVQRRAADGTLNTTIVDRNYNAASTAPGSTIPRLLNQAETAHIPKIRKSDGPGIADFIRKDIEGILEGLRSFPKTLDIDGQGQFALGFYHQRAKIRSSWAKSDDTDDETKPKED